MTLWVLQAIAALTFLATGLNKTLRSYGALRAMMAWVADVPPTVVRLGGMAEVLGSAGLVLPGLTHIAPVLTPLAAIGLMGAMAGALVVHVRRREVWMAMAPIVLIVICAVIAWGRLGPSPLA